MARGWKLILVALFAVGGVAAGWACAGEDDTGNEGEAEAESEGECDPYCFEGESESEAEAEAEAEAESEAEAEGFESEAEAEGECDGMGGCDEMLASGCTQCAADGNCADETADCEASQDCLDFIACASACPEGDDACIEDCASENMAGASIYSAFVGCIICDECPGDCSEFSAGC